MKTVTLKNTIGAERTYATNHNEMMIVTRPTAKQVLQYARKAVKDEADNPSGWSYDRQSVEHHILNRFDGLTNSDDDYGFIVEAIREAENEHNEANDCELCKL